VSSRSSDPRGHRTAASILGVEAQRIHHLGVAVEDLDEAVDTYRRVFGAELEHRETVPEQGVEAAAVRGGRRRVELLRALHGDTPVGKVLAKRGPGMHHIAYEVSDLRGQLRRLAEQGVELIDEEPHRGLFGLEVAFVHPDAVHGVLAELVAGG
jgi:methylmalonyl-CoA/ethylmalonyl-CoA epimerase